MPACTSGRAHSTLPCTIGGAEITWRPSAAITWNWNTRFFTKNQCTCHRICALTISFFLHCVDFWDGALGWTREIPIQSVATLPFETFDCTRYVVTAIKHQKMPFPKRKRHATVKRQENCFQAKQFAFNAELGNSLLASCFPTTV